MSDNRIKNYFPPVMCKILKQSYSSLVVCIGICFLDYFCLPQAQVPPPTKKKKKLLKEISYYFISVLVQEISYCFVINTVSKRNKLMLILQIYLFLFVIKKKKKSTHEGLFTSRLNVMAH